jgi:hypothetical protein
MLPIISLNIRLYTISGFSHLHFLGVSTNSLFVAAHIFPKPSDHASFIISFVFKHPAAIDSDHGLSLYMGDHKS